MGRPKSPKHLLGRACEPCNVPDCRAWTIAAVAGKCCVRIIQLALNFSAGARAHSATACGQDGIRHSQGGSAATGADKQGSREAAPSTIARGHAVDLGSSSAFGEHGSAKQVRRSLGWNAI